MTITSTKRLRKVSVLTGSGMVLAFLSGSKSENYWYKRPHYLFLELLNNIVTQGVFLCLIM